MWYGESDLSDTAIFEPPLVDLLLGPREWRCCLIVGYDECIDVFLQLLKRGEGCAAKRLALEDEKPSLDLVEPGRARWREVEVNLRVFLKPAIAFFVGVEIIEDDVQFAVREGGNHAVHEAEKLDTGATLGMLGNNLPVGDLKRGKQGRGAVPPVIMALARQGASVRQLQIALRPLQRLGRSFFIDTEDNRPGGSI